MTQTKQVLNVITNPIDTLEQHRKMIDIIKAQIDRKSDEKFLILEYQAVGRKGPYTLKSMEKLDAELKDLAAMLYIREDQYLVDQEYYEQKLASDSKPTLFQKCVKLFQTHLVHRYEGDTPETFNTRTKVYFWGFVALTTVAILAVVLFPVFMNNAANSLSNSAL